MDFDYTLLRKLVAAKLGEFYREFVIRKRSGGGRSIAVPETHLMAVQRWIVREILQKLPVHPSSYAYSKGSDILRCAKQHVGADWLIKLDLHDFFPSISELDVYKVFRKAGYQPLVSFELARLCTKCWQNSPRDKARWSVPNANHRGIPAYYRTEMAYLPQGAPTSPMLSNLVFRPIDERLRALADEHGLVYTRYSDDLSFSAPPKTLNRKRASAFVFAVGEEVRAGGFRLHNRKISISPPGARKLVLGLLVDGDVPRLQRDFRHRVSDHVRGIEKFGLAKHAEHRKFDAPSGLVSHVEGLLRFAGHIDSEFADPLRLRLKEALVREGWSSPASI
jgi:RNA-directed DNA polymerase